VPLGSNLSLYAGLDSETNQRMGTERVSDEAMLEARKVDVKRLEERRPVIGFGNRKCL
jgi:hypothetical protein